MFQVLDDNQKFKVQSTSALCNDSGQNATQCYHRGELTRGESTRGEMGKGESGRHRGMY